MQKRKVKKYGISMMVFVLLAVATVGCATKVPSNGGVDNGLTVQNEVTQESSTETIDVIDTEAPVIELLGGEIMTIEASKPYVEPGFSATDNCDGDITKKVTIEGEIDECRTGVQTITYRVADASGNICEIQRTVEVVIPENQKVIYLTFDDGPSAHTQTLLDVLDKYGVKATFFVTKGKADYQNMIGEAHRRGHTIALHTYSHDYSIYSSEETYYADLQKIHDIVVAQTNEEPKIVRFPGGTSNTISKKYCKGIMSSLAAGLKNHGYVYCDWNVSSGDGGGVFDETSVYNNVINGVSGKQVAVVLQHDTQSYSVEAVDNIIEWGKSQGYIFLPLTENTSMVHHKASN